MFIGTVELCSFVSTILSGLALDWRSQLYDKAKDCLLYFLQIFEFILKFL